MSNQCELTHLFKQSLLLPLRSQIKCKSSILQLVDTFASSDLAKRLILKLVGKQLHF